MIMVHFVWLTDLRHICQNLNQFGHGRGTIYGGRFDVLRSKLTCQISREKICQSHF